jgi:DNA-binding MarR family transcriptional regulator
MIMKHKSTPSFEETLMLLLETAALVERRLDREIAFRKGISFGEYRILQRLAGFPDGTAMRVDLAEAVGLTPSAITRALKPLEKIGIISNRKSDRDARSTLARLTDAGRQVLADCQAIVDDSLADLPLDQLPESALSELQGALLQRPRQSAR